jgi:DNA-binding transcriptional LysR family regulator
METERLKQFRTIVDAGGLLKASEILGISGGGLSKSMKVLEEELNYPLFAQRGRGLELTERGRALYEKLPAVLSRLDELLFSEGVLSADADTIRIASFEVFTTYFLADVVAKGLTQERVEIREAGPGQMETLVAEGAADIGITYLPIPHARVEFVKAGRSRMAIYGLKKWAKTPAEKRPFAIPIAPLQGAPSGVRGLDGWPEHLFERHVRFRVDLMESALQLARAGEAVAFVPEFVVRLMNQKASDDSKLSELPLPVGIPPVYRDVFLIQRKGAAETASFRKIAKAIRAI